VRCNFVVTHVSRAETTSAAAQMLQRLALLCASTLAAAASARPAKKRYNTDAVRSDAPGVLNVHVIAHTHDDVGWLKTVDEYYAGLNNSIQHASVRHILESTVDSLVKDPARKFIYVEQAFFMRFYAERTDEEAAVVRELVAEGRLSFVNGGWSMHDEATTTYVDMVDNTNLGHRYIAQEFGEEALPSVTWSIDPFGHSSTQASLLSSPAAGFSALFVSRADYSDIRARTANKSLEYVWRPSASLGDDASTFFSIMNSGLHLYFPLPGLCCK
jgi:alpha-mannosidase